MLIWKTILQEEIKSKVEESVNIYDENEREEIRQEIHWVNTKTKFDQIRITQTNLRKIKFPTLFQQIMKMPLP